MSLRALSAATRYGVEPLNGAATSPGQLESIISLQKALTELATARERFDGVPDWMTELHNEHQKKKSEIEDVETRSDESARLRREAEAAMADAQEKLQNYQSQIGRVTTQREYGALLKEIDTAKEQSAGFEKQALEALEVYETANTELETLRAGFTDLDEQYQSELAKWEKEKPSVAADIKRLEKQVQTLRSEISAPYLRVFDRLFDRNDGDALAPVLEMAARKKNANRLWRCGVCNYQIRPQVVVEIRNLSKVIQCDCGKRILYVEPTEEDVT